MYFYTPRGLKIRLNEEYCLSQKFKTGVTHYNLLVQTEIFAVLRDFYAFVVGIFLFSSGWEPKIIFIDVFGITLFGIFLPLFLPILSIYYTYGAILLGRIFLRLSVYFIDKVILLLIGLILTDWKTTLIYFLGFYFAVFVGFFINMLWAKFYYKKHGIFISDVERMYINLSRINAEEDSSFLDWIKKYKNYIIKKATYGERQGVY